MSIDMRGIYLPEFGLQIEVGRVDGGRWQLVGARHISVSTERAMSELKARGAVPVRAYVRDEPAVVASPKRSSARRKRKGTSRAKSRRRAE